MSVAVERHEGWTEVILDRPERKNAINGPLGEGLAAAITEADVDDTCRVILLRGAGGAFCSGLDLNAFNADPAPPWLADFQTIWRGAHRALLECRKPIVGAMERYAINGGAALAIACDLLVVGNTSFLQVGEARIGMAAPYNLAWLNLRHPESVIARLVFVADRVSGDELVRLGVATESVDDADVLTRAQALATELAAFPEGGLTRVKAAMRSRLTESADAWFDRVIAANPAGGPGPRAMPKG